MDGVTAAADLAEPSGPMGGTLDWVPSDPRAAVAVLFVSCVFFSCFVCPLTVSTFLKPRPHLSCEP